MSYRTDLIMKNGHVAVREPPTHADIRESLPPVAQTDRLSSDQWGASLKREAGKLGDDPALNVAALAHRRMVDGFRSLAEHRSVQDPSTTQLNHLRQVERNFKGLIDNAARNTDSARATIKNRISTIKSEFETALKYTTKDAAEIRGMLRGMSKQDRAEFLSNAITAGDGNILGAVFTGHPSLSGLTDEHAAAYYRQAMHTHAPDYLKLMGALEKAGELLISTYSDLLEMDETITARSVREKLEATATRARKAEAKSHSSVVDRWDI
jgi:lipopolysaccharide biosynthesis regulator YciM